jgi:hypothetical protein
VDIRLKKTFSIDYRRKCGSKEVRIETGQYDKSLRTLPLEKNVLESTSYLLPLKPVNPVLLNGMQNLREHQLSSVCLVGPIWLGVK